MRTADRIFGGNHGVLDHEKHPLAREARAALERAREEAKQAYAAFDAERKRVMADEKYDAANPDPELVGPMMEKYRAFEELDNKAHAYEEAWIGALDDSVDLRSGKPGGKLANHVLGGLEAKALVQPSGTIIAPDMINIIVSEALRPTSILPLIGRRTTDGDEVRYLAEAAASNLDVEVVAAGATKPTSVLTVELKSKPIQTLATISEPLDRAVLQDFELFGQWIETKLREGLLIELENQVLGGPQPPAGPREFPTAPRVAHPEAADSRREGSGRSNRGARRSFSSGQRRDSPRQDLRVARPSTIDCWPPPLLVISTRRGFAASATGIFSVSTP